MGLVERRLVGFLRARGAEDAEGLANEVLVRVFEALAGFDGNLPQFRAWVYTIARNRLIDEHRREGRRVDAVATSPADLPEMVGGVEHDRLEDREGVEHLLEPLTDDQREVLLLRVVAGLSVEETALAVGRRAGAVRALQHRALRHLRTTLQDTRSGMA